MFDENEFKRTERTVGRIFRFTGVMMIVMGILSIIVSGVTIYALWAAAKWLMAHAG